MQDGITGGGNRGGKFKSRENRWEMISVNIAWDLQCSWRGLFLYLWTNWTIPGFWRGWSVPAVTPGGLSPGRTLLCSQNSAVCPPHQAQEREELLRLDEGVLPIPRAGMRPLVSSRRSVFFPKKAPGRSREALVDFLTRGRRVKYLMR